MRKSCRENGLRTSRELEKNEPEMRVAILRHISPLIFLLAASLPGVFGQGVVTTVAGTDWLFPADGQPAVNAPLSASNGPDLALDAQGNLYICDLGNAMVMRVGRDGIINVMAGAALLFRDRATEPETADGRG